MPRYNYGKDRKFIRSATLNGKPLSRNWITHQEIAAGGVLVITAGDEPDTSWGITGQFVPDLEMDAMRF